MTDDLEVLANDLGVHLAQGQSLQWILKRAAENFVGACQSIAEARVAWTLDQIDHKEYAQEARLFIFAYSTFVGATKRIHKLVDRLGLKPEDVPIP